LLHFPCLPKRVRPKPDVFPGFRFARNEASLREKNGPFSLYKDNIVINNSHLLKNLNEISDRMFEIPPSLFQASSG